MVKKIIKLKDSKLESAEAAKSFTRFRASAEGVCYAGVCAVLNDRLGECAIVAANINELRIRWESMTHIPLDERCVTPIAIFSLQSTSVK